MTQLASKSAAGQNTPHNLCEPESQTGSSSISCMPAQSLCREEVRTGSLIINADDWGRDSDKTERIRECVLQGTVSSVSGMVFMADSVRAASVALDARVDTGLHLNFTTRFSDPQCPPELVEHQRKIAAYLLRHPLARAIFHPSLVRSFEYVVTAQVEEYCRLYGVQPERLDGHHHMHLSANVLLQRLLPAKTIVRRNFSFEFGEKGAMNLLYRKTVDKILSRRHCLTDYFFSLPPLEPQSRLQRILSLARQFDVEVETHPVNPEEYRFLTGGGVASWTGEFPIAPRFAVRR
jgi:hypothetical protein